MRSFRTVPRYFLRPALQARYGQQSITLVDLSLKGVRFEAAQSIPLGESANLSIETHRGLVVIPATALWCQLDDVLEPGSPERYLAGVMFEKASEEIGDLLERLLRADLAIPIEDHRNADRFLLITPLKGGYGDQESSILDLSIRGARISLPQFVPVGTTSSLHFTAGVDSVEVPATTMWCLGGDKEGFEVGLKIEGAEDRLRIAINRLCMREEARIDLHSLRRRFNSMRVRLHQIETLIAS